MSGIGLLFAVILAVAYRFLKVQEDPRIEETEDLLPGSNCGACGVPGCHAFAEELVEGKAQPAQCTVAAPEVIVSVAELLNVDPGRQEKRVARLHCAGGKAQAYQIAEYHGLESCVAAGVVLILGDQSEDREQVVDIGGGIFTAYCRDPFGNIIELAEIPDPNESPLILPGVSSLGKYKA